jgi:hypothetical protein
MPFVLRKCIIIVCGLKKVYTTRGFVISLKHLKSQALLIISAKYEL